MPKPFENLVPSQDWVDNPPEPYYDVSCPVCFALVRDRGKHREFHARVLNEADALSKEAIRGATEAARNLPPAP
jgi:hypothetical protein